MDISSLSNISSDYIKDLLSSSTSTNTTTSTDNEDSFSSVFQSALDMVNETNDLQNDAETEEINFALGYSDSTHDLKIAQEKANIALSYTVAVRDRFLDAYNEIMNMQM